MAGQNDFLIFDENKDNMLTQELYNSDSDRTNGFKTGLARSNVNNKVLHQTSMMCHAIGEIGKENGVIVSDEGSVEDLKTALKYSFGGADRELSNLTEEGEKHFLKFPTGFGAQISITSGWTAPSNGLIKVSAYSDSTGNNFYGYIDGLEVYLNVQSGSYANHHDIASAIPIYEGQVFTYTGGGLINCSFYPYIY